MSPRRPSPARLPSPLHAGLPALVLALAASLLAPSPAAPGGGASLSAQTADPLRKSDLVRLLAAGSPEEVAASIRQRCLSFQPTPRDMEDLRAMGAGPAVIEAVGSCIAAPNGAAGDGAGSLSEAELTLFLDPRRVRVAPGGSVDVRAEVTGGAIPAPGVELVLLGAGGDTLGRSTTDPEGGARFDLLAGEEPGVRRVRVVAPGREVRGANSVEVEVMSEASAETSGAEGGGFVPASRRMEEAPRPSPALRRAERLSLSGQYGRAERIYREELEEDPQGVYALLGYGLHLARTGRHGEAERVLQQARRAAPERGDVARALGMVALWRGEPGEAVTWLRAAVEASPDDAEAWAALGRALSETGRRDEARRALERARSLRVGSEGGGRGPDGGGMRR